MFFRHFNNLVLIKSMLFRKTIAILGSFLGNKWKCKLRKWWWIVIYILGGICMHHLFRYPHSNSFCYVPENSLYMENLFISGKSMIPGGGSHHHSKNGNVYNNKNNVTGQCLTHSINVFQTGLHQGDIWASLRNGAWSMLKFFHSKIPGDKI